MGLASALSTALTGMTASETTIDVVGNNLANSNTVGFKASTATFATQFLQTQSLGSGPTSNSGGTNPRQIGLGTMVADITPNFNQGTIEISSSPTDLAIQGDGFFIVQGSAGDQLYTRNGVFKTNAQSQLVTSTGNCLLGYGVDAQFHIDSTGLKPLTIPLGAKSVAKATQTATLEGTLSPTGDLADRAANIETGILSDGKYGFPTTPATTEVATNTGAAFTPPYQVTQPAGGLIAAGDYYYKMVYADGPVADTINGTEGAASAPSAKVTVGAANSSVTLSGWTTSNKYSYVRFYRSDANVADPATATYHYVGEAHMGDATFVDNKAAGTTLLDTNGIGATTSYQYYITFYSTSTLKESRPVLVPATAVDADKRIHLDALPALAAQYAGQFNETRIYRNVSSDPTQFHLLTTLSSVDGSQTYTDRITDTQLTAPLDPAHPELYHAPMDPNVIEGTKISDQTLLKDLLSRQGSSYVPVFAFTNTATIQFTGAKGGRTLETRQLAINNTTTVQDLYKFMQTALGIQTDSLDPNHPMPIDANSGRNPGGYVTDDSRIMLVGNNGTDNAVSIGLSGIKLVAGGSTSPVVLPFTTSKAAVGESAVADFVAYDSLGIPLRVRLTAVLQSSSSTGTVYRWFADSPDNQLGNSPAIAVGTGLINFDKEGNFSTAFGNTVKVYRDRVASASPLEFTLDFTNISGLSATQSTLAVSRQDGSAPGVLTSFIVGEDGLISGVFSNGITRDLGQLRLARFGNPAGLEQKGQNLYGAGVNSGLPIVANPNQQGIGSIIAGAQELSNTDIGGNLIDLILASTMYRGNARVVTTIQQMFDELLNLRR